MSCSINTKNLSYKHGKKEILKDITFNLGHKEKIAIIGPNGVGKSTFLKILAGLTTDYDGELYLFHDLIKSNKDFKKYRNDIAYLPQNVEDYFLCPIVIEDIMFNLRAIGISKEIAKNKALEILEKLNILHLKNRIIYDLSGGEQKIVALASILITHPKIILLDEPTNALDIQSQETMIKILNSLEKSLIIVSHHRDFIEKIATTIYTLKEKKIFKS